MNIYSKQDFMRAVNRVASPDLKRMIGSIDAPIPNLVLPKIGEAVIDQMVMSGDYKAPSNDYRLIIECIRYLRNHGSSDWNPEDAPPNSDRPYGCRENLIALGRPYPKSNCVLCGSILSGKKQCPYDSVKVDTPTE